MGHLGVTEWENLGYRDSDMMGRAGNHDPRSFWRADLDEAAGRLVWLMRRDISRMSSRPTTSTAATATPTTSACTMSPSGPSHGPAIRPVPGAARSRARRTGPAKADGGLAPWAPSKLYEQAYPASFFESMRAFYERTGQPNPWAPPEDATPEQLAEMEAEAAKMLVPDETISAWIDVSGEPLERKWAALAEHKTQIAADFPMVAFGLDGWRELWTKEAYILRESRVETARPEDDLFAGSLPAAIWVVAKYQPR